MGQRTDPIKILRKLAILGAGGISDTQLLDSFLNQKEDAAFQAMVKRHGTMVLSICRRILRDHHDAEDAFQATFLVLVRKARGIANRELLGNWLYGVAYRAALKMRRAKSTRLGKERQLINMRPQESTEPLISNEMLEYLDHELNKLPEKLRAPIVFCDLEDMTRNEAARKLGCSLGTLNWRLAEARDLLAKRLKRHGLTLGAAGLGLVFHKTAVAAVPTTLISATVKIGTLMAAGQTIPAGMISAQVAALTKGLVKTMFLSKLKMGTAILVLVGSLGIGAGGIKYRALATEQGRNGGVALQETNSPAPGQSDVQVGNVSFSGKNLTLDSKNNTAEIKGAGVLTILSSNNLKGELLAEPTKITIRWNKNMFFDGETAEFHGEVEASQDNAVLTCENMFFSIDKLISFKKDRKENQVVSIRSLTCDRQVRFQNEIKDKTGQRLQFEAIRATQLNLKFSDGRSIATGPGKMATLGFGTDKQNPDPESPAKEKDSKKLEGMQLTRIFFEGRMFSNNSENSRTSYFYNNVEVFHFPTEDPDAKMDPDNPPQGGFYMVCNNLKTYTKVDGYQSTQMMQAEKNVFFRATEFFGRAEVVKYNQNQEQVIFEGAPGKPAILYRKSQEQAQPQEIKGSRIIYNRATGAFQVEGGNKITTVAEGKEPRVQDADEVVYLRKRRVLIPINIDERIRGNLLEFLIFASWEKGGTYQQVGKVAPDENEFIFEAKQDGNCWFKIATVDKRGNEIPVNIEKEPPGLKIIIDTVKPLIRTFTARRLGKEVLVDWEILEDHFDLKGFLLEYKTSKEDFFWTKIKANAGLQGMAIFEPTVTGPIWLRLTAKDLAGNVSVADSEIAAVSTGLVDEKPSADRKNDLTPEEVRLLPKAQFELADLKFKSNEFSEALRLYQNLQDKYRNEVEGLIACQRIWRCVNEMVDSPQQANTARNAALEAVQKAKADLEKMPEDHRGFRGGENVWTKGQWQSYIRWIEERLNPLPPPPIRYSTNNQADIPKKDLDLKAPTASQLVEYLNNNAQRVKSLRVTDLEMTFTQGLQTFSMRGALLARKPRDFRLVGNILGNKAFEIGSNDKEFWYFFSKAEPPGPFYCSHKDLAEGKVKELFPFQYEWLLECLGLGSYGPAERYKVVIEEKTIKLVELTRPLQGKQLRKIIVLQRSEAPVPNPQVLAYLLLDDATGQEVFSARVAETQMDFGTHAVLPRRLEFHFQIPKLKLEMKLDGLSVNPDLTFEPLLNAPPPPQIRLETTKTDQTTPPKRNAADKQLEFNIRLCEGDPLGSVEAKTITVLSTPRVTALPNQTFLVNMDQKPKAINQPEDKKPFAPGLVIQGTAGSVKDGKVPLELVVSFTTPGEQTEDRVQVHEETTRTNAKLKLGELVKLRLGKGTADKQRWVELTVQETTSGD